MHNFKREHDTRLAADCEQRTREDWRSRKRARREGRQRGERRGGAIVELDNLARGWLASGTGTRPVDVVLS